MVRGVAFADLGFDVLIVGALWCLWRVAWLVIVVISVLGGITLAVHPERNAWILALGVVQLVLLFMPALRQALHSRPVLVGRSAASS